MLQTIELKEFLKSSENELVIDVRTPLEFEQGHIIGAKNIPMFSNEERVLVGTCYKQESREAAILLGFELIGGRWAQFIREVESLTKSKKVFIYCWRGGMRSGAVAWALDIYGFEVIRLSGGYKTYRNYALDILKKEFPILILSGKTGCAKTDTLLEMRKMGEQVIDLEGMVNHQGSSFGSKGDEYQPSQEHFENQLAHELNLLDVEKKIWFENESIVIGKRVMPPIIFQQMRETKIIDIKIPITSRIQFLDQDYGILPKEFLKESVLKISKRLGPNETKLTLHAIDENRMTDFIEKVLVYYDKTYERGQLKRKAENIYALELDDINYQKNAAAIIHFADSIFGKNIDAFKTKNS